MNQLLWTFIILFGLCGLQATALRPSVGSGEKSTVTHMLVKPHKLKKFQVLKVTGPDAILLSEGLGHYLNPDPKAKIVGIRSMICESEKICWLITSKADIFEPDDLVANESYDLSPFKKINPRTENAFLNPSLDQLDKVEEMSSSSEAIFSQMSGGKNVIIFRKFLLNGAVESKTLRGEKIEIRCFHEVTGLTDLAKHFYNCQVYALISK